MGIQLRKEGIHEIDSVSDEIVMIEVGIGDSSFD
jgi:hypothetical protein